MLPRTLGGASFVGYMPPLAGALGPGSFDSGRSDRFTSLLRSGCRHGREFKESWTAMVDEVEAISTHITTGPLAVARPSSARASMPTASRWRACSSF